MSVLLPAYKLRPNIIPTNRLDYKMKRIFWSEGSDVAAQRSSMYVFVCGD